MTDRWFRPTRKRARNIELLVRANLSDKKPQDWVSLSSCARSPMIGKTSEAKMKTKLITLLVSLILFTQPVLSEDSKNYVLSVEGKTIT